MRHRIGVISLFPRHSTDSRQGASSRVINNTRVSNPRNPWTTNILEYLVVGGGGGGGSFIGGGGGSKPSMSAAPAMRPTGFSTGQPSQIPPKVESQKVYVVESDITNTQKKVSRIESKATIQ